MGRGTRRTSGIAGDPAGSASVAGGYLRARTEGSARVYETRRGARRSRIATVVHDEEHGWQLCGSGGRVVLSSEAISTLRTGVPSTGGNGTRWEVDDDASRPANVALLGHHEAPRMHARTVTERFPVPRGLRHVLADEWQSLLEAQDPAGALAAPDREWGRAPVPKEASPLSPLAEVRVEVEPGRAHRHYVAAGRPSPLVSLVVERGRVHLRTGRGVLVVLPPGLPKVLRDLPTADLAHPDGFTVASAEGDRVTVTFHRRARASATSFQLPAREAGWIADEWQRVLDASEPRRALREMAGLSVRSTSDVRALSQALLGRREHRPGA